MLQHAATYYNVLQLFLRREQGPEVTRVLRTATVELNATHYNTLQHAATRCNLLQHAATCCNMLQHAATCNG